jgi:hypothetical protein
LNPNPERAVEIPEQIILVQNFTAVSMAQIIFISYRSGDIQEIKYEKSGNLEFAPLHYLVFLGQ